MNSSIEHYLKISIDRCTSTDFIFLYLVYFLAVVGFGLWKGRRMALLTFAVGYCVLIIYATVFSRPTNENVMFNILPFSSYTKIADGDIYLFFQVIMNIVMFIPVGLLLKFTFNEFNWEKILLCGLLLSIVVEFLQLLFMKGVVEIDDVIHNTLGVILGYSICVLIAK